MTDRVICGYQPAAIGSNPSRWPRDATIRYRVALAGLPGVNRDAFRACFRGACDMWESECGLWFDEVDSKENFVVTSMAQQPGGVLADCTLPYQFPVRMRVDASEPWSIASNPPPNRVDLLVVLAHEIGHGIGLDHGGDSLMRPTYDPRMTIGDWERQLVCDAYGPPRKRPGPQPAKPTADEIKLAEWVLRNGQLVLRVANTVTVERMT